MRPLNRPMFRYGGPIKEGIMSGIKEKNTIAGGNQVGTPMGNRTGFADPRKRLLTLIPGFTKQYNKGIANLKKILGFLKSKLGKTVSANTGKEITSTVGGTAGTKFIPNYLGRDPGVRAIGSLYRAATGDKAKGVIGKAASTAVSPTGALTIGAFTDALPGGNPLFGTRNILGQKFDKETGIKTEGLFGRDLPAKQQLEDQRKEAEIQKAAAALAAEQAAAAEAAGDTGNKQEKMSPELFEDRKKYYYKLMGLDNMKKDDIYDSLIDASKIVQEEGADLKGALRSGTLQSRIIDAVSKNLDDSEKLKRQIDAAVLKGEIEKDVYQSKPSSSEQLITALSESGGLSEKEVARSRLGLPINVSQAIQTASVAKKGAPLTHNDIVLAATNYAALDNKKIQEQLDSDQVDEKIGSGKEFANELAFVESILGANPDPKTDDGFYIVGTKLIEVVKGKPIPRN